MQATLERVSGIQRDGSAVERITAFPAGRGELRHRGVIPVLDLRIKFHLKQASYDELTAVIIDRALH